MSMSGHREHINSRPTREIFLTSSSLSFSSLSSSVSWDDAVELSTKESKASSSEDNSHQNGELSNASSSKGSDISGVTHVRMQPPSSSEISGLTHVRMQPAPSPPSRLRPVHLMNKGIANYDPGRIPASVFGKNGDVTWSEISNESLFSLKIDGYRKSNAQAPRQSNLKPEEVLMSGEFLKYSPSLVVKPEDAKEKRSEVKEIKNEETRVQSHIHQEKYPSFPDVPLSSIPTNFYCLYAPPIKGQSYSRPVGEKKSKKRKRRKNKTKNKKEKKKKKECCTCMWSWLCSVFSK